MFGDHYYYVQPDCLQPTNEAKNTLWGNRCPLIVYNPRARTSDPTTGATTTQAANAMLAEPKNCGETLNRFCATMDLYPTVCSLFGIVTDQQLTYGRSIFDDSPHIGVGYLNGYTWGAADYDAATDRWQIWATVNFQQYQGTTLSEAALSDLTPTIDRIYESVFLNHYLLEQNGFTRLNKAQAYGLGSVA